MIWILISQEVSIVDHKKVFVGEIGSPISLSNYFTRRPGSPPLTRTSTRLYQCTAEIKYSNPL